MIWPGALAANATAPWPPVVANSVMNRPPPETARVIAPHNPRAPAVAVVVRICTFAVIQDNSPGGATRTSPGSRPTSSTGMVVPVMRDCMGYASGSGLIALWHGRRCDVMLLRMETHQIDIAVIGAGIAGSTVAAAL